MNNWRDTAEGESAIAALRRAQRVVAFTGAGMSAASGIATFRDAGGFWTRFPPEQFANWKGIASVAFKQPELFMEFLLAVLEPITLAKPNSAHLALAKYESQVDLTVVTQNIDGLHQEAGSTRVLEIHGSILAVQDGESGSSAKPISRTELQEIVQRIRAVQGKWFSLTRLLLAIQPILGIGTTGFRRPALVLFGDGMAQPAWSQGQELAEQCDVLLAIGTSGSVYPAAELPAQAELNGAQVITIDPESHSGGIWLRGTAGDILPELIAEVWC